MGVLKRDGEGGSKTMSMEVKAPTIPSVPRAISTLHWRWGWMLVVLGSTSAVVTAANLTHDRLFHKTGLVEQAKANVKPDDKPRHDLKTTVVMPEGKFQKAGILVEAVQTIEMPKEVSVSGKIEADPNRRVDIRPKASGVVRTVPVLPGTKVKKGDTLVVLDSPEVGSARLLVRERQRALATIRIEANWKAEIALNTRSMIEQLRKGIEARNLAKTYEKKEMGNARATLLLAFTELEIAAHEQEKQSELKNEGIIGEHLLFVAQHTREGAQGKFDAALEVVGFQVKQDDIIAKQMVRNAEEMVVDAAQRLRILGVIEDIHDLLDHPEKASSLPSGTEDLVAYSIIAPIDGTIVTTSAVISQKVEATDSLFVVADLSKVYTVAFIHESDFGILPSLNNGKVRLTATAYPGRHFDSRVLYVGSEFDPTTRTVRLVAETDNPDALLKLGMFAKIVLDTASTEKALTVPLGAIVEVEGKPAVFVPGEGERTFIIREVKLGREALGRQVITEGLKLGDKVVVAGAFLIKSELILQNETGED
jgi:cobalt-zinc-cadmium efflux system membrane fusion protein